MRTRANIIPDPSYETRKIRTRTQHMGNKSPTRFYYKEETKQNYDKKTYLKLMLNKLKIMSNLYLLGT
jgi:hypothetical protein